MAPALAELGKILLTEHDLESMLTVLCRTARDTIAAACAVSITLMEGDRCTTPAYSDELALVLDEMQYVRGHGPCVDAGQGGEIVVIHDMAQETRWPDYTPRAEAAGAASSVSAPLPVQEQVIGAINVYFSKTGGFVDGTVDLVRDLSGYAAVAVMNASSYFSAAQLSEQLHTAMRSRATIEQAKGILIGQRRCSSDEAFAILTKLSQDTNRKLRDVCAALVAEYVQSVRR